MTNVLYLASGFAAGFAAGWCAFWLVVNWRNRCRSE
jgi:hypothetical protein